MAARTGRSSTWRRSPAAPDLRGIIINLLLFGLWAVLSAGLVWGTHRLDLRLGLEPPAVVLLWLGGELLILAPVILFLWKERGRKSAPNE